MADERVVIRIDINADTRGIDRVRRKLRELAAEAEVLDRRMSRLNGSLDDNADAVNRVSLSHDRAAKSLNTHSKSTDAFDRRLKGSRRQLDLGQKTASAFAKVISTSLKFALIGASIEMVALGVAVSTVNGLFAVGQGTIKLYRFAMAGVAYAAAAVTAAVATAAAAQREYNAAIVAYRYKSLPALGSGTAQAMSALRMLATDQQLATFGMQNLNAAFAAVSKNAEFSPMLRNALRGIGDFAVVSGDMGKGLTAAANFIGLLQKSGKLTEEVLSAAAEVGPEFQKSIEEAQKRGLTSADALMRAMASGELAKGAGLEGALQGVNDTLMGQLKAFLTEMMGRFADIGQTFLPSVKKTLYELSSIFRVALNRISADLGMFGSGKLMDDIVKVTAKLTDLFVTLFEKYLPQSEGMLGKLGGFFSGIGDIFMKIRQFLEPMREGAKVITDTFGPVVLNILKGFGDSMGLIARLAVENQDAFQEFGNALTNVFDTVQRFFNDFKKTFVASMPFLTNLMNVFSTAVGGVLTVLEKLFNLVGDGPQAGLLAVLLGGGAMVGLSQLKDYGLGKNRNRGGMGDWLSGASQRIMSGNVIRDGGGLQTVGTMMVSAGSVIVNGAIQGGMPNGKGGRTGPGGTGTYPPGVILGPDGNPLPPSGKPVPGAQGGTGGRGGAIRSRLGNLSTGTKVAGSLAAGIALSSLTGNLISNPMDATDPLNGLLNGIQTGATLGALGGPKGMAIGALIGAVTGPVAGRVNQADLAPGMDPLKDPFIQSMAVPTQGGALWVAEVAAYFRDRSERDNSRKAARESGQRMGSSIGATLFAEGGDAGRRALTSVNETVNTIIRLGEDFNGDSLQDRIDEAQRLLENGAITQEAYAALADAHHGTYINALMEERDVINEFATNAIGEYTRNIESLRKTTGMSEKEISELASSMGVDLSDASITLADAVTKLGLAMDMTTEQLAASMRKISFEVIENIFTKERRKYETNAVVNQAAEELRGGGTTREARVKFLETLTTQANNMFPDDPFKALQFVIDQVGIGGRQFSAEGGPLQGLEGEFGDMQPMLTQAEQDLRARGIGAFGSQFGANMQAQGIQIDRNQLISTLSALPLDQLMPAITELNNLAAKLKTDGLTGQDAQPLVSAAMDYLGFRDVGLEVTDAADRMAQNVQSAMSEGARQMRETLKGAIDATPPWWNQAPPWWNSMPGVLSGGSDTNTPRAFGDSLTSRLGRTMSRHGFFDSQLRGKRTVTSSWRNWGLGSINSDHVTGNAYDLTGQNLGAYASMVNRMGGFAEFHGAGGERHLHVVPGQTPVGDAMSPVSTPSPVAVGGPNFQITINTQPGQDTQAIAAEVMAKIEAKERSNRERA